MHEHSIGCSPSPPTNPPGPPGPPTPPPPDPQPPESCVARWSFSGTALRPRSPGLGAGDLRSERSEFEGRGPGRFVGTSGRRGTGTDGQGGIPGPGPGPGPGTGTGTSIPGPGPRPDPKHLISLHIFKNCSGRLPVARRTITDSPSWQRYPVPQPHQFPKRLSGYLYWRVQAVTQTH